MQEELGYIPGVCNIGKKEIRMRLTSGYLGLVATLFLGVFMILNNISLQLRLIIFIPAFVASIGLLQGYLKFCAQYGIFGVFNLTNNLGNITEVQKEYLKKDRIQALKIVLLSVIISTIVTLIFLII